LRVFADGQRSAWLTLHRTGDGPLDLVTRDAAEVQEALVVLMTAAAGARRGLPDRVAVAVVVDAGPDAELSVLPQNWLPTRYLVTHTAQVAADLLDQLAG
jgi:hypothetical protein